MCGICSVEEGRVSSFRTEQEYFSSQQEQLSWRMIAEKVLALQICLAKYTNRYEIQSQFTRLSLYSIISSLPSGCRDGKRCHTLPRRSHSPDPALSGVYCMFAAHAVHIDIGEVLPPVLIPMPQYKPIHPYAECRRSGSEKGTCMKRTCDPETQQSGSKRSTWPNYTRRNIAENSGHG